MKIKQARFLCGFFILANMMLKDLGTEGATWEHDSTVVILRDVKEVKEGRTMKQRLGKGGKMQTCV